MNLNEEIRTSRPVVARFGCGDDRQALVWLLRRTAKGADGRVRRDVAPLELIVEVPGLAPGDYQVTAWDTEAGAEHSAWTATAAEGRLVFQTPAFIADMAFAIRPVGYCG